METKLYPELEPFADGTETKEQWQSIDGSENQVQVARLTFDRIVIPVGEIYNILRKIDIRPWWKKKPAHHDHLREMMIDMLNKVSLKRLI